MGADFRCPTCGEKTKHSEPGRMAAKGIIRLKCLKCGLTRYVENVKNLPCAKCERLTLTQVEIHKGCEFHTCLACGHEEAIDTEQGEESANAGK